MQTVLITGASSGIGWATACHLAERGFRVYGTTRSVQKRADVIEAAAKHFGERLQFVAMDVTDDDSVNRGVATVIRQAGGIDALVANAGFALYGSVEEMPMDLLVKQFNVNVFGCLRTVRAVLPHMRERRAGRIILVSSVAATLAIPFQAHYSATKYAVDAFTEGLRQELRGFGIAVTAIRPGNINTPLQDATVRHTPPGSPYARWSDRSWKTIERDMRQATQPERVAKAIGRILNKKKPKAYYTVADFPASLAPMVGPLVPSRLKEKLVRLFYRIDD